MKHYRNLIITASAGTGKTFRLASEYIRLLLDYYEAEGFRTDNILVLTFTRKATGEIRDRIARNLELLCSGDEDKQEKRAELVRDLKLGELTPRRQNILLSAWRDISQDHRQLQVMTIDSYVNSIFRNIVRPLRSIDDFTIDQQAVEKRLPHLLKHLMTDEVKSRADSLLRRRVSPSLDEYGDFFGSLIRLRWLYFLIRQRLAPAGEDTLQLRRRFQGRDEPQASLDAFLGIMEEFLQLVLANRGGNEPAEMFNQAFRNLFFNFPVSISGLSGELRNMCATPQGSYRFYRSIWKGTTSSNLYNGNRFRKKTDGPLKSCLDQLQQTMQTRLADHLVLTLFLEEQEEILDLWQLVLDEYDKLIYRYRNLTHDDVSWFTLEALFSSGEPPFEMSDEGGANEFYQFLSHRSRFVLIDEFQDTSVLQLNILKPIIEEVVSGEGSRDYGGLVVVGDEKQSIFGWRGGERELLLNIPNIFDSLQNLEPERLEHSWRSSPSLMEFINGVFGSERIHGYLRERSLAWQYAPIASEREDIEAKTLIEFKVRSYQKNPSPQNLEAVYREFVLQSIKPAVDAHPEESIAVLCRRNSELGTLQNILDECGVTSIYQPSSTLDQHVWVAPLIAWLRFVAFGDWMDFLAVLRSNYIMLKAVPLKAVVDQITSLGDEGPDPDFQECPVAEALYRLAKEPLDTAGGYCQALVDICLPGKELHDRDYLNLEAFLKVAREFDLAGDQGDKSVPAFLDYLEDNRQQDFMKQVAVEGAGLLELLTIHSSKGLQFDRVFLIYNLSSSKGYQGRKLDWFMEYTDATYKEVRDFALTYHYEDVLRDSSFRGLADRADDRTLLEEMNNLYVAFTRARTALQVCFAFQGKEGWEEYFGGREAEAKLKLPALVCQASLDFFALKGITADGDGNLVMQGREGARDGNRSQDALAKQGITAEELAAALPGKRGIPWDELTPRPEQEHVDLKRIWLEDRSNLVGDLAHHYLSFIFRDRAEEHEHALQQVLSRFGSIMPQREILGLIERLRLALKDWAKLFEPRWDKVWTELTLYYQGRELRLDRLMLDTTAGVAKIVDFKTGEIDDPTQLDTYARALGETKAFRSRGIRIETEFIRLKQ
jgi:ATP-dependent exoDNAse (exonuclease V) beta subunit